MVRGRYPAYMDRFFREHGLEIAMEPQDAQTLKEGTVDYYACSYYMTNCIGSDRNAEKVSGNLISGLKNPYLKASEFGWQIDPNGLRYLLNQVYDRYQLPIMIVENGLGSRDELADGQVHGPYRISYLRKHIQALEKALEDGAEVIGYMPWRFLF